MKVAVLSDIHGNWEAFAAVVAAIEAESPDQVVVGGDLVGGGGRLADIIDVVRERGWPCVAGNSDEMLWRPERIEALAVRLPQLGRVWDIVRDDIRIACDAVGDDRLSWLRGLPEIWRHQELAVVHASPGDKWSSPAAAATDDDLARVYGSLERPLVVYGHVHIPFVRRLPGLVVANSGAVGLPGDGDRRAAYLTIVDGEIVVHRVAYDIEREIENRTRTGYPHAGWIAQMLRAGAYAPP